ncbi:MAG: beta galactosidase jelly roll domain-containing protein [Saprospirales bacterium]|nr:beta galactosidase jelly roll domain-containing protein [Saprospirales bacterium]
MKKISFLILFIASGWMYSIAQDSLLSNVYNRPFQSLNGEWNYIVDPYENGFYNYRYEPFDQQEYPEKGAFFLNSKPADKTDLVEYDFDQSATLTVPGDWNSQSAYLYYYEGTVWYKTAFDFSKTNQTNRVFLYFGAVNYQADVYLNGVKLGTHIGGFTPFNFDVTDQLQEKDNFLVVKVDNKRKKEGVPTLNTDWWNYGGITRDVKLIETPATFIQDYFIQLNPENKNHLTGYVKLSGRAVGGKTVRIAIPELDINQEFITISEGVALVEIKLKNVEYWSPSTPHLYTVELTAQAEKMVDKIGFRTLKTEGHHILLNDEPVFLKGISIHEERPFSGGRVHSIEDAMQLLTWAKELGCNYVRLAHYPHNEHMVRLADQLGIMVWEENPVYWTISWDNEATYLNAENQLTEVITRDKNRASVLIWSMANETPTSDARNQFLTKLAQHARQLDPTRLISAALEQRDYEGNPSVRTIDDPFAETVDILSFNEYIGWYDGLPEKCREITWKITQDKPVIISEFGAGAKFGFHGDSLTRWSEEYQENLYKETLHMLDKIPQLQGISPWILMDFRSPRRVLPGIQDHWNRKGLISEMGEKKKAFWVLKAYYEGRKVRN